MTRRKILILVAVAVPLVSILLGLVTGPASAQQHWPGWLEFMRVHPWQSLIVLTALSLGLAALATLPTPQAVPLKSAADRLATAVGRDWLYEAQWRKVFDPYPLPVRWVPADPDLLVAWPTLLKLAEASPGKATTTGDGWASGPAFLAGADNDLFKVLSRVPTGRLIVLGSKGAGKTILLVRLVLDMISRRQSGDPVPIMLPLASWNPVEEDLHSLMVRWLITDRAGLAGMASAGKRVSMARALVEEGLILPVLDGLDEIPEKVRGTAIDRINEGMRPGQALILASRTDEYRTAVHPAAGEVMLTGAAGIELCPLDSNIIADYLKDSGGGGPAAANRWAPVIDAFASDDPPPAAQVLTTPLMASLARIAYNPRPGEDVANIPLEPTELLDTALFPTSEAVEDYLFDCFIPASYRQHPDRSHPSRRYDWTSEQAERWLTFLAWSLEERQGGSTDLAWWKLRSGAPRRLVGIVVGLVVALVALLYPFPGYGIGLTVGCLAGLVARRFLWSGKTRLVQGLAGGLIGGLGAGFVVVAVLGPGEKDYQLDSILGASLAVGLCMGFAGAFTPGFIGGFVAEITVAFYEHASVFESIRTAIGSGSHLTNALGLGLAAVLYVELVSRSIPARGIHWSPVWFACGLITAVVLGSIAWIQQGVAAGLAVAIAATAASGLVGGIAESVATDLDSASNPETVLRRDRLTFYASGLGMGIALGFTIGLAQGLGHNPATGLSFGFIYGLRIGIATFLIVGIAYAFIQAQWGSFVVALFYLTVFRRLPWRYMTFLRDAHRSRGVLRQVGAIYQFRHVEVQRRIGRQPPFDN
jgi:hypothetical protein